MRLAPRTLLCCCVLTALIALGRSAAPRKRFKGRPQTKRDVVGDAHMEPPQQGGDTKMEPTTSSLFLNARRRRSPSKTSGCFLFSCAYHDLVHRLSQVPNKDKKLPLAPKDKMISIGRRRRRGAARPTDPPADTPASRTWPEKIPCWVCVLDADKDQDEDRSLGRTARDEDPPRPAQQGQ